MNPKRPRIADRVFETLLRAILHGELTPGEPVPTQRELSTRFGVSPLVVRQAIHRLEELQLVRVRQGSTTVALDPANATDVRLIQLQLEVAQPGDAIALAALENRALAPLSLLVLAERRITAAELTELDAQVGNYREGMSFEERVAFMAAFWELIARATRNPVLHHQVRWWYRVSGAFTASHHRSGFFSRAFFEELVTCLRKRSGAMQLWLEHAEEMCDWTEVQPGHAIAVKRRRASTKSAPV